MATATRTSAVPTGPDRCHTSQLSAAEGAGQRQTGTSVSTWSLTNTSSHACTLYGFVGMALQDQRGHDLPTMVVRGALAGNNAQPARLVLAPKQTAHWTVTFHGNTGGSCPPATSVAVTPPDELDPVTVKQPLLDCDYALYISALYQ